MKRRETYWGLLFIIAAVLILLNQFGFFHDALSNVNAFTIVASVILGGITLKSLIYIDFWGIFFPIAFIAILFSKELHIEKFTPWPALFTAFCLSVGFSLIFRKSRVYGHRWHYNHHDSTFGKNVINQPDNDTVKCSTSFGECIKYVNSDNFQKADIKSSFGTAKVYFDHAQVPSGKADIYLDVSFGDAKLYIPSSWNIINDVHVVFGDTDIVNKGGNEDSPVVTIHGNVSFGNAKVYYV